MTTYDVLNKLIGKINPVGESNTDNERFENLKVMSNLVKELIRDIDSVAYNYKDSHQFSVKRAGEYAMKILDEIGIKE